MNDNNWLDSLARDAAQGLSRRDVFRRVLGGGALAMFSAFGITLAAEGKKKDKDCGKLCEECCHNAYPNGGREYGQCVSDCQHGEGLCGPIVCPDK